MKNTVHGWREFPLVKAKPQGWIRSFLERQRDGLTGHLEVAGYPFNTGGWLSDDLPLGERGGTGWWPYEQTAYWIDGMMRCGLLLGDPGLTAKARRQVDHVMAAPDSDGYLGPRALKELKHEFASERWPHAVFFRSVIADYDARPARRTLNALVRHYLSGTAVHETARNICNIEIMAWLFEKTGDERMRKLALASYQAFQKKMPKSGATLHRMARRTKAKDHGPTYMELFKLAVVLYRITGDKALLDAAVNAQRKLVRDHVLIDGVPSTTEHLRGIYSTAGHETCVITDYLWSLGYLLMATRNAAYADAMERVCFNALPGAVTPDFRALQYFSGPNQVVAGPQTNHHPHGKAGAHISFRPNPATECCPGNVHRAMPAYAGRMWLDDGRGGVVAALYGPSTFTLGRGTSAMTITQQTEYPFSDRIIFRFSGKTPVRFPFTFRIPGWCENPEVAVNGKTWRGRCEAGTFVTVHRAFKNGDCIELTLPSAPRLVRGPEQGAGVEWGPLVLALRIRENMTVEKLDARSNCDFPAWTMEPASPWNVALVLGNRRQRHLHGLVEKRMLTGYPWEAETTPWRLYVPVRRVPGWRVQKRKKLVLRWGDKKRVHEGNIQFMPPLPDKEALARANARVTMAELVPYGATRLRITWFPVARNGDS
jgi:hypothetical protein